MENVKECQKCGFAVIETAERDYCMRCDAEELRGKGSKREDRGVMSVDVMKRGGVYWIIISGGEWGMVSIDVDEERALRVAKVLGMGIFTGK